mmetsp:Transcript_14397/g.33839  ORF Transcript_14397/g.33839 Transcript_14397/m.33839 type:complete len:123 (-) Transcript_14397:101-469(-)
MAAGIAAMRASSGVRVVWITIAEAHAEDEWPIGTPEAFRIPRAHRTMRDRAAAMARTLEALPPLRELDVHLLDTMQDGFLTTYGAWPTCLYWFRDGRFVHRARPVQAGFDLVGFWNQGMETI